MPLPRWIFTPALSALLMTVVLALAACGDDGQSPPVDQGSPVVAGCQDGTVSRHVGALSRVFPPELERRPHPLRPWLRHRQRAAGRSRRRGPGPVRRPDRQRDGLRLCRHQLPCQRPGGRSRGRRRGGSGRGGATPLPARSGPHVHRRRVGRGPGRGAGGRAARGHSSPAAWMRAGRPATSPRRSTTSAISACCSTTSSPA